MAVARAYDVRLAVVALSGWHSCTYSSDTHDEYFQWAHIPITPLMFNFMIMPVGATSFSILCAWAQKFSDPELNCQRLSVAVGDEGGFALRLIQHLRRLRSLLVLLRQQVIIWVMMWS